MREIKLRIWHMGEMIYINDLYWFEENMIHEIPKDTMEFIGLKDKNGKEIYEADIVKGNRTRDNFSSGFISSQAHWEEIREVKFEITDRSISLNLPKDITYSERHPENEIKWEVIGNIYENPELLNH